jgi:hypothetical protein
MYISLKNKTDVAGRGVLKRKMGRGEGSRGFLCRSVKCSLL